MFQRVLSNKLATGTSGVLADSEGDLPRNPAARDPSAPTPSDALERIENRHEGPVLETTATGLLRCPSGDIGK